MNDITHILTAIEHGDSQATAQLLPLVYQALRKLATQRLGQEKPGQTLQATALVHEAYIRLVGPEGDPHWESRGHFFGAAAEAMRRILVENARQKSRLKRGGNLARQFDLDGRNVLAPERPEPLLALDEALERLRATNPQVAELVKLRFFAGYTNAESASLLGISPRKADQLWAYARAWLREELEDEDRG